MYRRRLKPVLDLMLAAALLIFLAPVLILVALAVRVYMGAPVLFRQPRPGLGGRVFTLLKFRTMTFAHDGSGRLIPEHARLTRLGRVLRATSVDELPELINVVKGEMSLVGPRPLLCTYLARYSPQQARRHEVKPGITGWAQVNGRNALMWDQKFELDVWYVDHLSLAVDIQILFRTVVTVFRRRGINHSNAVTAPEFLGDQNN